MLHRKPAEAKAEDDAAGKPSFMALFNNRNRRATIFASVPWFLQDLGTYGIGIFTPTILAAALGGGADHIRSLSDMISDDILAAKGAAMINVLLIVGIVCAVMLADITGRIKLQILGFIGCAVGLLIASFSIDFSGPAKIDLIFAGFMLFSFMTNLGPNAQTYLLAGEVFPTEVRGMGAGFAAAFAKIGAVATAFLFPDPARRHRHARAAVRSCGHLDPRRGGDVDVPDRDHRREPRSTSAIKPTGKRGQQSHEVPNEHPLTVGGASRPHLCGTVLLTLGLVVAVRSGGVGRRPRRCVRPAQPCFIRCFSVGFRLTSLPILALPLQPPPPAPATASRKRSAGMPQIGASDAYMSDEQAEQNRGIVNIPLAIAAQTVNYNLPGLNGSDSSWTAPRWPASTAARSSTWDAPEIVAMNPGVKLPHETIVPIRRADASGDTFVFTQFLDFSTQRWEDRIGYGTTVAWPERRR